MTYETRDNGGWMTRFIESSVLCWRKIDDSIRSHARVIITLIAVVQPALLLMAYRGMSFPLMTLFMGLNFAVFLRYVHSLPPKAKERHFLFPSIPLQLYSSTVTWTTVCLFLFVPPQ